MICWNISSMVGPPLGRTAVGCDMAGAAGACGGVQRRDWAWWAYIKGAPDVSGGVWARQMRASGKAGSLAGGCGLESSVRAKTASPSWRLSAHQRSSSPQPRPGSTALPLATAVPCTVVITVAMAVVVRRSELPIFRTVCTAVPPAFVF